MRTNTSCLFYIKNPFVFVYRGAATLHLNKLLYINKLKVVWTSRFDAAAVLVTPEYGGLWVTEMSAWNEKQAYFLLCLLMWSSLIAVCAAVPLFQQLCCVQSHSSRWAAYRACSPTLRHLRLSVKFTFSTPLACICPARGEEYCSGGPLRRSSVTLYWRAGHPVGLRGQFEKTV